MSKIALAALVLLGLIGISSPVYSGIARMDEQSLSKRVHADSLQLDVEPIRQAQVTSCGEAAIVMAHNFVHPDASLQEETVIDFASMNGFFLPEAPPFTSPASMVKIARHYAENVSTGNVLTSNQGLALLARKLQEGVPIIIDVRTRLEDPNAGAHFVVVTGISVGTISRDAIMVRYNDPLTGTREAAPWGDEEGIWNAWEHNDDPGGSGWWMVIEK